MSINYVMAVPSNEYYGSIALIYSEIKNSLLRKVKNLSIKIDKYSCEDIIHDAFEDLLKRESISVESSINDALKKYLTFKTKLNAKSFLQPRYKNEKSKSTTHLDFLGLDYDHINAEDVNDKIISEQRLEVQKIKKYLTVKEWKIIELYFYQNLSVREIGRKMECSYGTIHIKLKNIISKIQKIISTDGAYAPSVTKINYPSLSGLAANGQNNLQYAV